MKKSFWDGLDNFELHNVLELLLFFSIPQKAVNETAHELIIVAGEKFLTSPAAKAFSAGKFPTLSAKALPNNIDNGIFV